jgi:hypothetical protein
MNSSGAFRRCARTACQRTQAACCSRITSSLHGWRTEMREFRLWVAGGDTRSRHGRLHLFAIYDRFCRCNKAL